MLRVAIFERPPGQQQQRPSSRHFHGNPLSYSITGEHTDLDESKLVCSPSRCALVHFIFCFFRFFRILTCFRMSECGTLLRMWAINFSFLPRRRVFLPGWRWARIMQLALAGSSSSLHSEVCKALKRASACFTTNFLSREFAFARLPPKRRDFAREDFNRNEVGANILCLGLGGMFGISVLVGVFAVCLVATQSRC
jgi:hypothetical protein